MNWFTRSLGGRRRGLRGLGTLALVALFTFSGLAAFAATLSPPTPTSGLAAVGPVSEYGFPVWYKDKENTRVELCLDILDPLCRFVAVAGEIPADPPDPFAPLSVPDNFPEEAFYWAADSALTSGTGVDALLTLALEAAWLNGPPELGANVTFSRIRIRIAGLSVGDTYTITHPYGVDQFVAENAVKNINVTEDCGINAFGDPLSCRIGPFLRWDSGAPAGWLGDPTVDHQVTGSPYGTNYFRIEGPNVGGTPNTTPCPDKPGPDCIQTDLFTVMGKLATNAGVSANQAIYARDGSAGGTLDLHASSEAGQSISASKIAGTLDATAFVGDGAGGYYARIPFSGDVPGLVTIVNDSDTPNAGKTKTIAPVDLVTVSRAEYNADTQRLTIEATSSDRAAPGPTLTVDGFGVALGGTGGSVLAATIDTPFPPATVTVRSTAGGVDTEPVQVVGGAFAPIDLVAIAPLELTAIEGSLVSLDGSSSQGAPDGFSWQQMSGAPVALSGANTAVATFSAPAGPADLTFRLTVSRLSGDSDQTLVLVHVPAAATPTADAGPDQTVAQGALVTLDGSSSTNAVSFAWYDDAGGMIGSGPTISFTFPNRTTPMLVTLNVTGPAGSASDTLTLTPLADAIAITQAQYTASKDQWRIRGTAAVEPNRVFVYYRSSLQSTRTCADVSGLALIGSAPSDLANGWEVRVRGVITASNPSSVLVCSTAGAQATQNVRIR